MVETEEVPPKHRRDPVVGESSVFVDTRLLGDSVEERLFGRMEPLKRSVGHRLAVLTTRVRCHDAEHAHPLFVGPVHESVRASRCRCLGGVERDDQRVKPAVVGHPDEPSLFGR